jgi:transposase
MGMKYAKLSGDLLAIENSMKVADKAEEFRRFQAIYLRLSLNLGVKDIAKITGFSESWVRQLHHYYKKLGLEGLKSKPKGGRNNDLFSKNQELEVLSSIEDEAKVGGILEVSKVHAALEKYCDKSISKQTTYNILHRHGWRKIAPRPKHPKSDALAQETFKKTGKKSLKKLKKTPIK